MRALSRTLGLLALLAVAACGEEVRTDPVPLDRLAFPASIAAHEGRVLVVSTNFDLAYDRDEGGSVVRLDPEASGAAAFQGGVRIPSFGGELAVADAAACGLPRSEALVPSRSGNALFRLGLEPGGLACDAGCRVGFGDLGPSDPYGVAVSCPPGGPARAWIGHLRGVDAATRVSVLTLADGARRTFTVPLGAGRARSFAYDASRDRLFFTAVDSGRTAPLRWIELGGGCTPGAPENEGGCPVRLADLWTFVRGAELRGVALSNELPGLRRRLYVTARLYDADVAGAIGARPGYDIGSALLVLELEETSSGELRVHLVGDPVRFGMNERGISEVRVLPPREGAGGRPLRDVVAVTVPDQGLLVLYDDELGQVARVLASDPHTGAPLAGRSPFGLAATPTPGDASRADLYVSSFSDGFVSRVVVPLADPSQAVIDTVGGAPRRIGQRSP